MEYKKTYVSKLFLWLSKIECAYDVVGLIGTVATWAYGDGPNDDDEQQKKHSGHHVISYRNCRVGGNDASRLKTVPVLLSTVLIRDWKQTNQELSANREKENEEHAFLILIFPLLHTFFNNE